ncbi:hypothetical protein BGZ65_010814 [Modicella reniformis]|uniref:Uncharacterized protein n=1 Tax=Modicella reniformis TaxID=1440133 RepID=A0A9P6LTF9_9FUNG|nr:hypothetical protein BGZ65_010814 [Modicella reniformis]
MGCEFTSPDNQCYSPCVPIVKNVTQLITEVIGALEEVISNADFEDHFSPIALSPFVTLLEDTVTNLTNVGRDHDKIVAISGTVNSSVVDLTLLFKRVQYLFPPAIVDQDVPVVQMLENIIPVLQQLLDCTGVNAPDCVGLIQLFYGFEDDALGLVSEITVLIPDLTPGVVGNPMTTLIESLTKVVDSINLTLTTGDTTQLALYEEVLNGLIGTVSGNIGAFDTSADIMTLLYESAQDALQCVGVNTTQFSDVCTAFKARMNGVLHDIIKFIQNNVRAIPVIGSLIVNPLIAVFNAIVTDHQEQPSVAISETLAMLDGLTALMDVTAPGNLNNPIREYLTNIHDITTIPAGCDVEDPIPCIGTATIAKILANSALDVVNRIPSTGEEQKKVLPDLIKGLISAIASGSVTAIQDAYDQLRPPVEELESILGTNDVVKPFRFLLDMTKKLLDCLASNPDTDLTTPFPVSTSV